MQDLEEVRSWFDYWQFGARDPYASHVLGVDYPPHAFLLLWPLAIADFSTTRISFAAVNIVITILAAWMFVSWMRRQILDEDHTAALALTALVLSGSSVRVAIWLGQTISLAVLFAAIAMRTASARPWLGGLFLAFASFKPHVAIGFGLAWLLTRQFRALGYAACWTFLLWIIFGWTLGEPPWRLVHNYLAELGTMYARPEHVVSATSMREVFDLLLGVQLGVHGQVVYACSSLLAVIVLARRAPVDARSRALILMACLAWSITVLPHQRHSLILTGPICWLLLWTDADIGISRRVRLWIAGTVVAYGVIDGSLLIRLLGNALVQHDAWRALGSDLVSASYYPPRVIALVLFSVVLVALANTVRTSTQATRYV